MIRVLIVDDEAPARAKLWKLLEEESDVELIGEAGDGDEAVDAIRREAPDLVFLDIQMPRRDGFEVIDAIGADKMPRVVFVTAFDEHAVRAFEMEAFDYLLKPFAPSRLRRALDRVRKATTVDDLASRLERVLEAADAKRRFPTRIRVRRDDKREVLVPLRRVDVIRSQRNYLHIYAGGGRFVRRGTLAEMVKHLDPDEFLQINRSEVVRLDAVAEMQPWFRGDARLILQDGTVLTWSRRFRTRDIERFL